MPVCQLQQAQLVDLSFHRLTYVLLLDLPHAMFVLNPITGVKPIAHVYQLLTPLVLTLSLKQSIVL